MIREDKNMKGAYSVILTQEVYVITEKTIGGDGFAEMDAPVLSIIGQEEFTSALALETLEYV